MGNYKAHVKPSAFNLNTQPTRALVMWYSVITPLLPDWGSVSIVTSKQSHKMSLSDEAFVSFTFLTY